MSRKQNLTIAGMGVAAAVAITSSMDATGLTEFSALPLFGLTVVFCLIQRLSPREIGLQIGPVSHYLPAILLPVSVMAMLSV